MKKYLFNWYELKIDGQDDPEAILTLTYALTIPYNTFIASKREEIERKLHIQIVPNFIFTKNYLVRSRVESFIVSRYTVKDPLSYFTNPNFLFSKIISISEKLEYLYILSRRAINDESNEIPNSYFSRDFRLNPLVKKTISTYKLISEKSGEHKNGTTMD